LCNYFCRRIAFQWEELYKSKPDKKYEDPKDVAAIKEAQANMGDFKLKTSSDFVVPEHLRMDTVKKKYQILTLQGLVCLSIYRSTLRPIPVFWLRLARKLWLVVVERLPAVKQGMPNLTSCDFFEVLCFKLKKLKTLLQI